MNKKTSDPLSRYTAAFAREHAYGQALEQRADMLAGRMNAVKRRLRKEIRESHDREPIYDGYLEACRQQAMAESIRQGAKSLRDNAEAQNLGVNDTHKTGRSGSRQAMPMRSASRNPKRT
jgi:hypothetical protein